MRVASERWKRTGELRRASWRWHPLSCFLRFQATLCTDALCAAMHEHVQTRSTPFRMRQAGREGNCSLSIDRAHSQTAKTSRRRPAVDCIDTALRAPLELDGGRVALRWRGRVEDPVGGALHQAAIDSRGGGRGCAAGRPRVSSGPALGLRIGKRGWRVDAAGCGPRRVATALRRAWWARLPQVGAAARQSRRHVK